MSDEHRQTSVSPFFFQRRTRARGAKNISIASVCRDKNQSSDERSVCTSIARNAGADAKHVNDRAPCGVMLHRGLPSPILGTTSCSPPSELSGGRHRSSARSIRQRAVIVAALILLCLSLWWIARHVLQIFHWAEHRVDRDSWWHAFLFFVVTLPFHTGLPIPIVHQAWAVAIGCFFRWRAFPILVASLSVGVPLPFLIGRRVAKAYGAHAHAHADDDDCVRPAKTVPLLFLQLLPHTMVQYLVPLRHAIALRPVRSAFLLMWAPLPTSALPLLLGILLPPHELPLSRFVLGALPSKLLHFACDVLVGIEAGSLARALDAHDDLPGANANTHSQRHARTIAIGTLILTLSFVIAMGYAMHQALREMKTRGTHASESELEAAPLVHAV